MHLHFNQLYKNESNDSKSLSRLNNHDQSLLHKNLLTFAITFRSEQAPQQQHNGAWKYMKSTGAQYQW